MTLIDDADSALYNTDVNIKKILLHLSILLVIVSSGYARGTSDKTADIETTVRTADAETIQKELQDNTFLTYHLSSDGGTLLMTALQAGRDKDVIDVLLHAGLSADEKDHAGKTALMYACQYADDPEIVKTILSSGIVSKAALAKRIHETDNDGKTASDYAAGKENIQAVLSGSRETSPVTDSPAAAVPQQYAASQTSPSVPEKKVPAAAVLPDTAATVSTPAENPTPSYADTDELAAVNAYRPVYLFDVDDTGNKNTVQESTAENLVPGEPVYDTGKNTRGYTSLMEAARQGNLKTAEILIGKGTDINARDNDGWTALMYAVRYSSSGAMVHLLIKAGSDTKSVNKYGVTPLSIAAVYSSEPAILSELLADRSPAEDDVRNSFILAINAKKSADMMDVFLKKELPLNQMYNGKTPLMYAAEHHSDTDVISLFLKNGALSDVHTSDGKTAFDFASANIYMPHDSVFWALNTKIKK